MKKHLFLMSACAAAMALYAPETDAGSAGSGTPSQEPLPEPGVAAVGNAPDANVNPPTTAAEAKAAGKAAGKPAKGGQAAGKRVFMVWVQPGHDTLSIGQLIDLPEAEGDALRGAGRARYASEAEIKAGGKSALVLEGI
jgi:hypothetical protein